MEKILIIYDYASVRELLAEELAADGHLVVPIGKPDLVKGVIGTLRPDLVLVNLHINGKDRWDVLEEIRKQDPYMRVLVLSTYGGYQEGHRRSLADVYVIKSFRFEGLRQKVVEVLQRNPSHAGGVSGCQNLQPFDNNLNRLRPGF